jgi:hypothetical protein
MPCPVGTQLARAAPLGLAGLDLRMAGELEGRIGIGLALGRAILFVMQELDS